MNDKVLQAVIKLKDEITKPLRSVNDALKDTRRVTDSVSSEMVSLTDSEKAAAAATKKYEQSQKEAAEATKKHNARLKEASSTFRKMGGTVLATVGGGLAFAAKKSIDFEYAMAEVGAISKAGTEDLGKLTEEAKRLGATTKFAASEAAAGMQKYAMAGYDAEKILSVMPGTLALATAGNEDLALTCDIVSDAMTGLKLSAEEANNFVDIMTATITGSNTDIAMLGETLKYVAPVAGTLGVTFEDLALGAGLMGNAAIKASQAGTSLKSGLTTLIRPIGEAAKAMDRYNIKAVKTEKGQLDMVGTIKVLKDRFKDMEAVEKGAALASIFGQEAMAGWAAIVDSSDEDFNKLTKSIEESAGEAERIAEIYRNTTKGALDNLGSAFEGVALNIGQLFVPMINEAATKIGEIATAFNALDPEIQKNVAKFLLLVAAGGAVALAIGLLMPVFTGIAAILGAVATAAGVVAGVMTFLCTPVGAVIAALLALQVAMIWVKEKGIDSFQKLKDEVVKAVETMIGWWNNFVSIITAPINAVVNISKNIKEKIVGGKDSKGKKSAFGTKRVVGNDIPYRLHDGERVLTRVEADKYENKNANNGVNINVANLTVREEADINRIAKELVRELKIAKFSYGGGF